MNSNRILRIVAFAVAALAVALYFQPSRDVPDKMPTDGTISTPQSGMVVNLDPVTGKPMETIPPNSVAPDPMSSSAKGLVPVPSPVPGGGEMIDLQGRFQNAAVVSIGDSDSLTIECVPTDSLGGADDASNSDQRGGR